MTELSVPEDDPRFELWRLAVLAWVKVRAAEVGVAAEEVAELEEFAAAWKAAYSGWVRQKVRDESQTVMKNSARLALQVRFQRFMRESVRSGLLTPALQEDLRTTVDRAINGARSASDAGCNPATPRESGW